MGLEGTESCRVDAEVKLSGRTIWQKNGLSDLAKYPKEGVDN